MSAIYSSWGFRDNPFSQTPLPASAEGEQLLVGRDVELKQVRIRLASPPKLVTVEGRNGIGKTSMINVAAFQCWNAHQLDAPKHPPLIPCDEVFQLTPDTDADTFSLRVLQRVVAVVSKYESDLLRTGRKSTLIRPLVQWLTTPVVKGGGGGISARGFGIHGSTSASANSGDGFKNTGFDIEARKMLADLFPGNAGGVVCTIDNLELMKTSKVARDLVEALRDRLFAVPGLRWVLSGAAGIVRGIVSTPRLSGFLHDPIEVGDIPSIQAEEIMNRRRQAFAVNQNATLPLAAADFQRLFKILAGNVRDTLSEADNFCTYVFEQGTWSAGNEPSPLQFRAWLKEQCSRRLSAAEKTVTDRPWQLFDQIVDQGGQCAPGDFGLFGFDTPQAMRSNVQRLEESNLIQSLRDEDDNRRKTILVTSSGWMVHFARSKGFGLIFEEHA